MNSDVLVAFSHAADGSMSKGVSEQERGANRQKFLSSHRITMQQTILVYLTYGGDDYRRYGTVDMSQAGDGITYPASLETDALFTKDKNLALLLPIADCIAAVVYDRTNHVLGLAHLGRHNLLQFGGKGVIEYMEREFGSSPSDVEVWMSPAAGKKNYPLYDFSLRSLHDVATEQLMSAGIQATNITVDTRDTTTDPGLFSHSEFKKGNRVVDGRQAVVCMMKP